MTTFSEKLNQGLLIIIVGSILLFVLIVIIFVKIMTKSLSKKAVKLVGNKEIIYSGAANYVLGFESVGGYLILTNYELIFIPHKINFQTQQVIIDIKTIDNVELVASMGIIPNGILIKTDLGLFQFIVFKRKEWLFSIKKIIEQAN